MRLTVLGACGTYPAAGGACSGYLVSHEGVSLWIDAGSGTLANLQGHAPLADVSAIVLSHMHADHFTDLYPFVYASTLTTGERTVPVFAPPNGADVFGRLLSPDGTFPKILDWTPLEPGEEADLGPFRLRTFPSAHSIENLTLRIEAGGTVLCYSGDTGPHPALPRAAQGADLFLCEASWQDGESAIGEPIHLTARQAGRAAEEAGARRLVLTHIWPHYDLERSVEQAAEEFDGIVELARTGAAWTVGT